MINRATRIYEQLGPYDMKLVNASVLRAECLIGVGRHREALPILEKARSFVLANLPAATFALDPATAHALEGVGRFTEACAAWRHFTDSTKDSANLADRAEGLGGLGACLTKLGRHDRGKHAASSLDLCWLPARAGNRFPPQHPSLSALPARDLGGADRAQARRAEHGTGVGIDPLPLRLLCLLPSPLRRAKAEGRGHARDNVARGQTRRIAAVGNARAKLFALLTAAALVAVMPGEARAEAGSVEAKTAARARGEQGLQLFEAKRWGDAYDAFREADGLYHAPTLTLFMGHCQRNLGRLVEAKALYAKLVSEPVPGAAPEQFRKAQAQARTEIDAIATRIPKLVVVATGADAAGAQIEIDGARVEAGALAAGIEVNPGEHALAAKTRGASAHRSVTLAEGEASRVELALLAADPSAADRSRDAAAGRRGSILPGVVVLGAGGVITAVGAITGGVAAGKVGDIKSRCRTLDGAEHCLVADIPARDSAQTLITVSTVGLVAGGAALLAGAALVILRPGGGAKPARIEIDAGLTAIHLRGSF